MKKYCLLLVFLPVFAFGQFKPWQITGMIAGLSDTSNYVMQYDIDILASTFVLDSLVCARRIPPFVFEYCRRLLDSGNTDKEGQGTAMAFLSSQRPIPGADLRRIHVLLNGTYNTDELLRRYSIFLQNQTPLDPALMDLFRSLWKISDDNAKSSILTILSHEKDVHESDLSLFKQFLLSIYPSRRFRDQNFDVGLSIFLDSRLALRPMPTEIPALIQSLANENNGDIDRFLLDKISSMEFPSPDLQAVYAILWNRVPAISASAFAGRFTLGQPLQPNDSVKMRAFMSTADCASAEESFTYASHHHSINDLSWMLPILFRRCFTILDLLNKYEGPIPYDTFFLNLVRRIKPLDHQQRFELLYFYSRLVSPDPKDLDRVKDIIADPLGEMQAIPSFEGFLTISQLNQRLSGIFRNLLRNPSIDNITKVIIVNLLLCEKTYSDEDIALFRNWLQTSPLRDRDKILSRLAGQYPMQQATANLISQFADSSNDIGTEVFHALTRLPVIPAEFWPLLQRNILLGSGISTRWLINTDSPMPVKYCFQLANVIIPKAVASISALRFAVFYSSGGSEWVSTILKFTAVEDESQIPSVIQMSNEEKLKTLSIVDSAWDDLVGCNRLKKDLARQIGLIVKSLDEATVEINRKLLLRFVKRFDEDNKLNGNTANILLKLNESEDLWAKIRALVEKYWEVILLHPLFWLLLLGFYGNSKKVQSFFFWNKNIRTWGGLGYVNVLLTQIPFLIKKLLSPFGAAMVGDANLDKFDESNYFQQFSLKDKRTGQAYRIEDVVLLKGRIVIEGKCGIGKTMLICKLLVSRKRLAVFLKAVDCKTDLENVISSKFSGVAEDDAYVSTILYNSNLDVYIDGVNEAGPEARTFITTFVRNFKECNCFITTQPGAWEIPAEANLIQVFPLEQDSIVEFLHSRYKVFAGKNSISEKTFREHCDSFITANLGDGILPELAEANRLVLSNPFDLTIVAQLLLDAGGGDKSIHLFALQEQYYRRMIARFSEIYPYKGVFPLEKLSQDIFQRNLNDNTTLPYEDYREEIDSMAESKMVFNRVNDAGAETWYFRHDKIRDFFVLRTFLEHKEYQTNYIDDPRFRGVYLLLANYLSMQDANALQEILVLHSADTNDYSVSSDFIRLLRNRKQLGS